jgi:hypothetical protein
MPNTTTNLGFWKFTDNAKNWHHYFNSNIDIFNSVALKLQNLADVDITALTDKAILKYNSSTGRWEVTHKRE